MRPWAEPETAAENVSSTAVPRAIAPLTPIRRPTICYSPPNPAEVRKEALKKKKEHDAAMRLYIMWEDSPLGVPDGEGGEGKMWGDYIRKERMRESKAGERRY